MSKPFDLKKALAGEPVETKEGTRVLRIVHLPEANLISNKIYAVLEGYSGQNVQPYNESGHVGSGSIDLVMAPRITLLYVNLWLYQQTLCSKVFSNMAAAEDHIATLEALTPKVPRTWYWRAKKVEIED